MIRNGMTIAEAKRNMKKYGWWKFSKEQSFETGEINLYYTSGNEMLTLFFRGRWKTCKDSKIIKAWFDRRKTS